MAPGINHVIVNTNDYAKSKVFYGWLLPQLGFGRVTEHGGGIGWSNGQASFWIKEAASEFKGDTFSKDRVGICEIALSAESRAQIDRLAREVEAHGASIIYAPREYDYVPGYYAVFFADPDGVKLELVHVPLEASGVRM
jgi:catechol 2,3-dioxygenase-like lactoylglutathione lyase family enzyme